MTMDELKHWGIPKGGQRANHKYYKRDIINGKYRYWYSAQEYNTWLKTKEGKTYLQSKGNAAINALNNKNRPDAKKEIAKSLSSSDQKRVNAVVNSAKAATAKKQDEKEKVANATSDGNKKIEELKTKSSKKSSGSSGSSSSKSSKGSKGASSSSSKKAAGSQKKEAANKQSSQAQKTNASDSAKDATIKKLQDQIKKMTDANKKKVLDGGIATTESLKKLYGVTESNKHANVQESIDKMKSYPDGSFGYISAGGKMYKWSKQDGKITFKDNNTDQEVALQVALTNVEEFRTDKKKKNSLSHSFKGSVWKNHKYIRKNGKKYIYKETYTNSDGQTISRYKDEKSGETILKNEDYEPERYTRSKFFKDLKSDYGTSHVDTATKEGEDVIAKLFKRRKKRIIVAKAKTK